MVGCVLIWLWFWSLCCPDEFAGYLLVCYFVSGVLLCLLAAGLGGFRLLVSAGWVVCFDGLRFVACFWVWFGCLGFGLVVLLLLAYVIFGL